MLKKTWKALILCAVAAVSFANSSASAGDGFWRDLFNHQSDCIQFTATEEILFMGRDSRVDTGGSIVNGPDAGVVGFNGADFNHEAGYRVSLGVQSPERRVEAIFGEYGDWAWRENGSLTTGLNFDGGTGFAPGANQLGSTSYFRPIVSAAVTAADETDGLGPTAASTDTLPTYENFYYSNLQDLQINWLDNDCGKSLHVGIGYRNVQLDELAGTTLSGVYRGVDVGAADDRLTSANLTGAGLTFISGVDDGFEDLGQNLLTMDYQGSANNDLNGFQFITDLCLVDRPRFNMSIIGKAGAYHNHSSGRIRERYTGSTTGVPGGTTSVYGAEFSDSKDTVAFVGGVAVKAGLRLTHHLRLIGGYEGIFVSGVALAPEQAAGLRDGEYQVNTDGNVIVHGANVGLELTY